MDFKSMRRSICSSLQLELWKGLATKIVKILDLCSHYGWIYQQKPGETRLDLVEKNAKIFKTNRAHVLWIEDLMVSS